MGSRSPMAWACGSCAVYAAIALGPRVGLPFVRFPAFQFPVADGATAVPLFTADGRAADVRDYTGFAGLGPDDVDVMHHGVACSVEHALHEERHWIAEHLAAAGDPPGTTRVSVGLRILSVDAEGRLVSTERVDATGTARPR